MAEIPHTGSTWRRGRARVTVEKVWQSPAGWMVNARFPDRTTATMTAEMFLGQFRHVAEPGPAAVPGG